MSERNSSESDSSGLSSSSDDEDQPGQVKKRRVRATRTVVDTPDTSQMSGVDDDHSNIYSNKVAKSWLAVQKGLVPLGSVQLDKDEEDGDFFHMKKKTSAHRKRRKRFQSDESEPDENVSSCAAPNSQKARSPSPPSLPAMTAKTKQRKARRSKGLQEACKHLEQIKKNLDNEKPQLESPKKVICIVDDGDSQKDAAVKEITVKIRSRSGIQRFTMTPMCTFHEVITQMAQHEFVRPEQIIMFLNDRTIHRYDTPASLNLHIADIIECHIRGIDQLKQSTRTEQLYDPDDPNVISVTVQSHDAKNKTNININLDVPMERLMLEYARRQGTDIDKLMFYFDGELVKRNDIPRDLDLDDDYCIDVIAV